jgi:autotransporter-associated beta strand protein
MTVKYSGLVVLVLIYCSMITMPAGATDLAVLQQNYVDQDYGLFLHYSMGTYTNEEWAHSLAPTQSNLDIFNPTGGYVNTDQWAQVAVASGMKYGVLTSKHHDGFALWNTAQSTYDIASTTWYTTHPQDIVGDFVNSFRDAGLGVGIYYSFWDKFNGIGPKNYSDDYSIGLKSSADATAYIKAEIHDLLTSYGHIDVLWADGWGWADTSRGCTYAYVNYQDVYNYIKQVSPDTLLVNNVNEGNLTHTDIVGREVQFNGSLPSVGNTVPNEACVTLRSDNHWFDTGYTTNYKSATYIGAQILTLNYRNCAELLDVPPDDTGTIPVASVTRLAEIKAYLATTPGLRPGNLAYGKTATQSSTWSTDFPAGKATDDDRTNISHTATSDTTPWWRVDLGSLTPIGEIELFNRVIECSGRLRDITVEILAANGTTVLYTSGLLNPDNIMGGGVNDYANGPTRLCLFVNNGTPVTGRYIRVRRTAETSGSTNLDDLRVLSLSDVEVYAARPNAIKWKGATSVWDVNTTENWFNTAALIADKYHMSPTADSVTFSDVYNDVFGSTFAPTTTAVTLNTTVSPSAVVFDADTLNYSLSGTGGISGGTSLVKNGSGTVTISTSNSYTGGTMLNSGALSIGANAALGAAAGSLTINGGRLSATGSFSMARPITINAAGGSINTAGNTVEIGGSANTTWGAGTLVVDGSTGGKLKFNRTGGTVAVDPTAILQINAGATVELAGTAATYDGVNALSIINNSTSSLLVSGAGQHAGDISGVGNTELAAGADLTVNSLVQNTLIIGAGAKLILAPIVSGQLAASDSLSTVPEPSTLALLALAAISMAIYLRRNFVSHEIDKHAVLQIHAEARKP